MEKGKRYTVLTYIFNGYEKVHEVGEKDPEADYVLVTDDERLKSDTWRVVVENMDRRSRFGKCYEVRFHPFRYANTPIVVRVDGSIEIKKSLKPIVDEFERGKYARCLMIHPHRNTLPEEYEVWIKTRGYSREQADRCMTLMGRMGYDMTTQGLYQGCFEIVRDSFNNTAINDLVFGVLCSLSTNGRIERIDQTVTSFVLNRFFSGLKILPVSEDLITDGELMQWYLHGSDIPIPRKSHVIEPMLFGRACKVWRPKER